MAFYIARPRTPRTRPEGGFGARGRVASGLHRPWSRGGLTTGGANFLRAITTATTRAWAAGAGGGASLAVSAWALDYNQDSSPRPKAHARDVRALAGSI
jgi:hypothetical protein